MTATDIGPTVESQVVDAIFQRREPLVPIDAPPGAGKTYLIESIAAIGASRFGWRVAVCAPRREQALEFARRVRRAFGNIRVELLHAAADIMPADVIALGIGALSDPRRLSTGPGVVVATVDKLSLSYEALRQRGFDLVVFDEAYQTKVVQAVGALALARQVVLVGDPGQLEPFSEIPEDRFEAARDPVHRALPIVLLERYPDVEVFKLAVTRRLPPDSIPLVQSAFYPRLPFGSTAAPGERTLAFDAAGRRDFIDNALDQIASGQSIILMTLPALGYEIEVDSELSQLVADVALRILERGARWPHANTRLESRHIGYSDTHVVSGQETRIRLRQAGVGPLAFENTPEIVQGLQAPIVIVKHPLSGLQAATAFDLTAGRTCVMLTRHQLACIVVSRANVPEVLDNYEHDCGARRIGRHDDVWRGFEANRQIHDWLAGQGRILARP